MQFDCRNLNEIFNVDGVDSMEVLVDFNDNDGKMCGELNPFYGQKHTEETKILIRERMLTLCKDENFKKSRINFGEKNGMYGSNRIGQKNPMYDKKHSIETKQKMSIVAKNRYKTSIHPAKGKILTQEQKNLISERNSKTIYLKNPGGEIVEIKNITNFAKENDLNAIMLSRVFNGTCKKHRGYTK